MQPEWQKSFEAGQRLQARILYVDATSKRVCLTLLPHLVAGQAAPSLPKENTLCQARPCSTQRGYCGVELTRPHSLITYVSGVCSMWEGTRVKEQCSPMRCLRALQCVGIGQTACG